MLQIFNKEVKPTFGVELHDKLNVSYRDINDSKNDDDNGNSLNDTDDVKYRIISQITINSSKNCLIFHCLNVINFLTLTFVSHTLNEKCLNKQMNVSILQDLKLFICAE